MKKGMLCAVLFACLIVFSLSSAAEAPLRSTLEKTWSSHLKACRTGKESELEKTISSFRLGTMKNSLASAKRSLTPDLIKSMAEDTPDTATAKFVQLMENGPTAGLVYVMDSQEQDASGKPRITFIFIKFVKEQDLWKVDGEMTIGSPKFQKNGKETEFDPSELPPALAIDGKVRTAPEKATAPDSAAMLDVSSYGYTTEIAINGVEEKVIVNMTSSGLIEKGLRKGKNSIVIRFTKTDKESAFKPRVTIRCAAHGNKAEEVFKFEPEDAIEGTHTFSFTVDE